MGKLIVVVTRFLPLCVVLLAISANAAAQETLTVPFANGPNGATTTNNYSGSVSINVSGSGQAAGTAFSDAFYLFTDGSGNPITPEHHVDFGLCINNQSVKNYLATIPSYRNDHTYQFTISIGSSPQQFTFGVCDTFIGDNSGSFTITVTAGLVTKQVNVRPTILQRKNIPLENLTVSTLLSEDVLAGGKTRASVTVADVNKGQIAFVSNIDGKPFVVAYIPASDIQNGTTSIKLGSIADGFIMSNPLMYGFRESDRQAILFYAKNRPLYRDLKRKINTALQTNPYKLLKSGGFPKIYKAATLLIIDASLNIGGEALAQKVVREALDIARDAIIGQTDVPYLNDLGQHKIEAVNPTMAFYGFNVAEQSGLARVIAGKESLWKFGSLQFTDSVKEPIDLGSDGRFNITFSKNGSGGITGTAAATANFIKINCIIFEVLLYCPASNKTIESAVEKFNDQTLASLGQDIWGDPGDPRAFKDVINAALNLLTKPGLNLWPNITRMIYGNVGHTKAAIKFLQKNAQYLKVVGVAFKILTAYEAGNVYLPFIWDGVTKPDNVTYCVTEANGVLTTCQPIPPQPPPPSPPPTPLADLSPTAILFNSADLVPGRTVFFGSGVQNSGSQGTGVFNERWFVDGVSVRYNGHASVPPNSTVLNANGEFRWVATAGAHTIGFAVDVDNHVLESNESNNSRFVTVTVTPPPPQPPPPQPPPPQPPPPQPPPPQPPPPPTDGGVPVITEVNFPSSIPGDDVSVNGTVKFTDSNAGVNRAQFDVLEDTCGGCFTPFAFDPGVSGLTEGQFGFNMRCTTETGFSWTMKLTLRDVQGHVSNPHTFSIDCVPPSIAR